MTRKEELISLLESIKSGMIDLDFFCSEFYRIYFDMPYDSDKIEANEDSYMKDLALMCGRYISSDYNLKFFYSEKDLYTKIGAWGKSVK
ncbi:MAG: hypothetical protein IJD30_02720 [Clostridia bacterium]|nr:hypothetical protein [Clostridia bacterium]